MPRWLATSVICLLFLTSALSATTYEREALSLPYGVDVSVLSNSGTVYYTRIGQLVALDTRTKTKRVFDIGTSVSSSSVPDVNAAEQVLLSGPERSFLWSEGQALIPVPGGSFRTNIHGDTIYRPASAVSDCYWNHITGAVDIGVPPFRDQTVATALNDHGQVVGVTLTVPYLSLGFIWDIQSGLRELPPVPGYEGSSATDINNHGSVVGYYYYSYYNLLMERVTVTRGFLMDAQGTHDLGSGAPVMMTDGGYVLIQSGTQLFVWDEEHGRLPLPRPATTYQSVGALSINADGDVLGVGSPKTGYPDYFIWRRTLPIPTQPVVVDAGQFTEDLTALSVSWSSSVSEGQIIEYQYAVSRSPGGAQYETVKDWTSAGTATSTTVADLALVPGTRYYVYVKAKNTRNVWSEAGRSDGIVAVNHVCQTPGEAKLQADGVVVAITTAITTGRAGELAYLEDTARSSGIGVLGDVPSEGTLVSSCGSLTTTADGERCITLVDNATTDTTAPVLPLNLVIRDAISQPLAFDQATGAGQRGITDPAPYGLSTTGLLVQLTATVTDMDANFVFINDGSLTYATGVRVLRGKEPGTLGIGSVVSVTGVSSMRKSGSVYQFLLKPRYTSDWQIIN